MVKKEIEPNLPMAFYYVDDYLSFTLDNFIEELGQKYSLSKIKTRLASRSFRSVLKELKLGQTCFFFLCIKNIEQLKEIFPHWQRASQRGVKFNFFLLDHSDFIGQTSTQLKESAELRVMASDLNTKLIEIKPKPSSGFNFEKIN